MGVILRAENLTKRYSNGRGAEDITFTLENGDSFGLLGANGAGKTTVMKLLTGLLNASSGTAELFGRDISAERGRALENVGAIIEAPVFYGYLSVYQNVKLTAGYYKNAADTDIEDVLRKVNLWEFRKDKASKLSLGMKQRLGLAITMIGKPELYILDEPSNGLDIEGRVSIRNIIIDLAKNKNNAFLISSHLSEEIEKTCNKVGIIKNGRMIDICDMNYILENYPSLEEYYLNKIGLGGSVKTEQNSVGNGTDVQNEVPPETELRQ